MMRKFSTIKNSNIRHLRHFLNINWETKRLNDLLSDSSYDITSLLYFTVSPGKQLLARACTGIFPGGLNHLSSHEIINQINQGRTQEFAQGGRGIHFLLGGRGGRKPPGNHWYTIYIYMYTLLNILNKTNVKTKDWKKYNYLLRRGIIKLH